MKKTFIVAALVLLVGSVTYAQNLTGGVKLGLNSSNIKYTYDGGSSKAEARLSGLIGFYATYMINDKFGFQPEFNISGEGSKSTTGNQDVKTRLTYINIPLLLRVSVIDKLNIHTGPQIGFLVSAKQKVGGDTNDIKDGLKGVNFAWALGAGYDLPKNFNVGIRYNFGLSDIADDNDSNDKAKVSTLQISLGYKLF